MASEDRKQQQPRLKKPKLGNNSNDDSSFGDNSLFIEFHEDKDILSRLKYAVTALNEGYNRMNLILVTVVEANARSSISFSRASCTTKLCKSDVFVAASVFQKGIEVLEQYIQSDELIKVPADVQQRNALHNLLQFLSEDHDALLEGKDYEVKGGNWAVTLLKHLFTKLAIDNKYIMTHYPKFPLEDSCGCIGDTSFGVELGWHGSVDILLEDNLPVKLMKDTDDSFGNMDSSIETKSNENITEDECSQLLAQTIVFSFLQNSRSRCMLNNSLIPGIGISSQNFYINMYDSVNDVLLSTHSLGLFGVGKPLVDKVVLLWLTLNYRYFCTGVTEEMINCKSEFHRRLDDMLPEYTHNVIRPLHIPLQINTQDKPNWYDEPGRKVKRSSETNEYYKLQKSIT